MKTVIQYGEIGGVVLENMPDEFVEVIPFTSIPPHEGIPLENQKFDPVTSEWIVLVKETLSDEAKEVVTFAIQNAGLSDEQALEVAEFYKKWAPDLNMKKEDIINFEDELYRVNLDHKSQSDWLPSEAASLYSLIKIGDDGFEEWIQPTGGHDAYEKGTIVRHNERLWESIYDGKNVWEPGTDERLWKENTDE